MQSRSRAYFPLAQGVNMLTTLGHGQREKCQPSTAPERARETNEMLIMGRIPFYIFARRRGGYENKQAVFLVGFVDMEGGVGWQDSYNSREENEKSKLQHGKSLKQAIN